MQPGIRSGRVSSVDKAAHTVKVEFTDTQGESLVSGDLQVLVAVGGDYALPAVGAAVVCLLLPGNAGVGFVLGVFYNDEDAPPLDDAGQRSIASDDLRLGAPDATDKVGLAPATNDNFDDLKTHFQVVEQVLTGPPISEPGNGAPSALQAALALAIAGSPYPNPGDVSAEKVTAK